MTHLFHPEAQSELREALRYYRDIDRELGADLKLRINQMISEIKARPQTFRLREGNYRRANLERFPFFIPYIVENESLVILAIAHNSRHPDYWKERIS